MAGRQSINMRSAQSSRKSSSFLNMVRMFLLLPSIMDHLAGTNLSSGEGVAGEDGNEERPGNQSVRLVQQHVLLHIYRRGTKREYQ